MLMRLDNFHEDFAHASLLNKIVEEIRTEVDSLYGACEDSSYDLDSETSSSARTEAIVSENLLSCFYNITMNSMW